MEIKKSLRKHIKTEQIFCSVFILIPSLSASFFANISLWELESFSGRIKPSTLSAPNAFSEIEAATAESIPPLKPITMPSFLCSKVLFFIKDIILKIVFFGSNED